MKKTLRRCLIVALLLSSKFIFSQAHKTEAEVKSYLAENIAALDPIEGIWALEDYTIIGYHNSEPMGATEAPPNALGQLFAILKEGDNFKAYDTQGDGYGRGVNYFTSKGITGSYFYYRMTEDGRDMIKVYMDDLFSMKYNYKDDPIAISRNPLFVGLAKRYDGGNTNNYDQAHFLKWTKVFPTHADYQNPTALKPKHEKSTGTGFAISSNGLIVTNFHVVENAERLNIRGINGNFSKTYSAKVVAQDKNNDLAIIKIDDYTFTTLGTIPYIIKPTIADVGENINVLGYPLTATMGEEIKYTNGTISSKSGFRGDFTTYQCSAPIQPGNSGGPVFDKLGCIIGIINAKHVGAENVSYAIKSTYLLNLIQSLPYSVKLEINALAGKSLPDQIKAISKVTFLIENE